MTLNNVNGVFLLSSSIFKDNKVKYFFRIKDISTGKFIKNSTSDKKFDKLEIPVSIDLSLNSLYKYEDNYFLGYHSKLHNPKDFILLSFSETLLYGTIYLNNLISSFYFYYNNLPFEIVCDEVFVNLSSSW